MKESIRELQQKRLNHLKWNSITSLVYQLTLMIGGFILPNLILKRYGSVVNGMINSITQFLGIISFLEMGVGSVVTSTLYKPLYENNKKAINDIVTSASQFYKKIAYILILYTIGIIFIFPLVTKSNFIFSTSLVVAIAIHSFIQYYFGIVDLFFLSAVQRDYIRYILQSIAYILSLIISYILMIAGASIQLVKLTTSLVFSIRPIIIRKYINKHYNVNRHTKYENEPISQKWNGIAQHVSFIVVQNTDIVVLTLFSSLENVSIYSIYNLAIQGVKAIIIAFTAGIQSVMGDLYARNNTKELLNFFEKIEWGIHNLISIAFGCTCALVYPFVMVYTRNIYDANYSQYAFGILLSLAYAAFCYRIPYANVIQACNHYKQTQKSYIISAIINILVSVLLVKCYGIIGVAIGTLVSMIYHTIWLANYEMNNLIKRSWMSIFKLIISDMLIIIIGLYSTSYIKISQYNYYSWIILAVQYVCIWIIVAIVINCFFHKDKIVFCINYIKERINEKN